MSNGFLRIWVRRDEEPGWGLLETLPYDDAKRRRAGRSAATLGAAIGRVHGWRGNYWRFFNASFCIEDQMDEYSAPVRVFGTTREKPREKGKLVRKLLSNKKPKPKPKPVYTEKVVHKPPTMVPKSAVVEMPEPKKKKKGGNLVRKPYDSPANLRKQKEVEKVAKRVIKQQARNWKLKDKGKL